MSLLWISVPRGAAQQGSREVHRRLPAADEERENDLKKHFIRDKSMFASLASGAITPTTPDQEEVIATAAKWFVYRVTWEEALKTPGTMDQFLREFRGEALLPAYKKRADNEEFRKLFCKQLIIQMRKVLNNDSHANRVRGALLLRALPDLGDDRVTDLLVEVLDDKTQFAEVKLMAAQALRDIFQRGTISSNEQETRCVRSLLTFLDDESRVTAMTGAGEVGAVRYIRRDIIRALGETRLPKTKGEKPALIALALLRFVVQDHISPAPSFEERVLAVMNLAQLERRQAPDYQPDYAAYHVAEFLVEYARQMNGGGRLDAFTKYYAAVLRQALMTFRNKSGGNDDISKYVAAMVQRANVVLSALDNEQPPDVSDLSSWLEKTPHSSSLFRGDPKAVVGSQVSLQTNEPASPP
jgi:hypothetical protein